MYGTHVERGDVDDAMSRADVIVEGTFRTPFIEHAYLEPEAGVSIVDEEGVVTVWMASQAVAFHQRGVAQVLGLPVDRVGSTPSAMPWSIRSESAQPVMAR